MAKDSIQNEALWRRTALGGALRRPRSPRYVSYRRSLRPCIALTQRAPATKGHSESSSEPALVSQFARFALVGVGNTALSWIAYAALSPVGAEAEPAAAAAFALGALNGYVWNSRWTFAATGRRFALARYAAVQLAGMAATTALVWALEGSAGRYPAYAVATVLVTLATFAANRRWTFGRSSGPRAQHIHSRRTELPKSGVLSWRETAGKGHAR
jgi:putative flippase GtrA